MTGRNRKLLAAGAAFTGAASLVASLAIDLGRGVEDITPMNAQIVQPATIRTLPLIEAFNVIADRPLFSPSRRPERPVVSQAQPAPQPAAAPPPILPVAALLAVIIGPERKAAVLRLNTGASLNLAEGESVAGWTLARVMPESVLLHSGGSNIEMVFADHQASKPGSITLAQSMSPTTARKRR